jgi:hypothetical protein
MDCTNVFWVWNIEPLAAKAFWSASSWSGGEASTSCNLGIAATLALFWNARSNGAGVHAEDGFAHAGQTWSARRDQRGVQVGQPVAEGSVATRARDQRGLECGERRGGAAGFRGWPPVLDRRGRERKPDRRRFWSEETMFVNPLSAEVICTRAYRSVNGSSALKDSSAFDTDEMSANKVAPVYGLVQFAVEELYSGLAPARTTVTPLAPESACSRRCRLSSSSNKAAKSDMPLTATRSMLSSVGSRSCTCRERGVDERSCATA